MPPHDLEALFHQELKDIYSAEKQILAALPKMIKAATDPKLKKAFSDHLKVSEGHVTRLEQVFGEIGKTPQAKKCKGMAGMLEEGKELLAGELDPGVLDAALIGAAQRVEHYEMAVYGTLRTWAQTIGMSNAARLLEQTLEEEETADHDLSELAMQGINVRAEAGAK